MQFPFRSRVSRFGSATYGLRSGSAEKLHFFLCPDCPSCPSRPCGSQEGWKHLYNRDTSTKKVSQNLLKTYFLSRSGANRECRRDQSSLLSPILLYLSPVDSAQ